MDNIALVNAYEAYKIIRKEVAKSYQVTLTIEPYALLGDEDSMILTARSRVRGIRFAMRFRPSQIGQDGIAKHMADTFITKFAESGKQKGQNDRTR